MIHSLPRRIGRSSFRAALLTLAFASLALHAEVKVVHVNPPDTDSAIEAVHGPHIALYDPQAPSNHKLLFFSVGTGAPAETGLPIDTAFAQMGYHVVTLDYENKLSAAAACAHTADPACLELYHKAIVQGLPGFDKLTVTPANSILNRLQKLVDYLAKTDPGGGWGEFLKDDQLVWSHTVVVGHSQGAGHAAYIGKLHKVDRVLMLSGPQEYYLDLDKPAPWQAQPGATPPSRYFAFLNLNDPTIEPHQLADCMLLMGLSKPPDIPTIEPGVPIHGSYQILVNDAKKNAHNSTASVEFENAWEYFSALP